MVTIVDLVWITASTNGGTADGTWEIITMIHIGERVVPCMQERGFGEAWASQWSNNPPTILWR